MANLQLLLNVNISCLSSNDIMLVVCYTGLWTC